MIRVWSMVQSFEIKFDKLDSREIGYGKCYGLRYGSVLSFLTDRYESWRKCCWILLYMFNLLFAHKIKRNLNQTSAKKISNLKNSAVFKGNIKINSKVSILTSRIRLFDSRFNAVQGVVISQLQFEHRNRTCISNSVSKLSNAIKPRWYARWKKWIAAIKKLKIRTGVWKYTKTMGLS